MDIQAYIQSGIIESYVLGLASAEEISEVEALKSQHPEVDHAIDDFSIAIEQQAFAQAIAPPSQIKSYILAQLTEDFASDSKATIADFTANQQITSDQSQPTQREAPVRMLRTWQYAAAASIILLIGSAILNFNLYDKYTVTSAQYQALLTQRNTLQANNDVYETKLKDWQSAANIINDPAYSIIKMPGVAGKEANNATVFWNKANKDVFIVAGTLPTPQKNKQYQLWALVDGKPVDAGMIDVNCTSVCRMKNVTNAQAFAITLENFGGSPTPTMEQLFVLGKV